jgi:outer membrane protein assembly factor BamE
MLPRILIPGLMFLAACSSSPDVTSYLSPYRIDVRQGNYVSQEMVAQLKPGMSRDQVRFVLGTPLVTDIFHADRWDYVYRFKPGRGDQQTRRFVVFFENDKLVRVGGDVVAATGDEPAEAAAPVQRVIEVPAGPQKKKD